MIYKETTQVPNILFDTHLPNLTESELKLVLVILRQTNGWIDRRTGQRKTRDRISHSQFMKKTGLCRRVVSKALQSLVDKGLIQITCQYGNSLQLPEDRKGVTRMYYSFKKASPNPRLQPLKMYGVKQIEEILMASNYKLTG